MSVNHDRLRQGDEGAVRDFLDGLDNQAKGDVLARLLVVNDQAVPILTAFVEKTWTSLTDASARRAAGKRTPTKVSEVPPDLPGRAKYVKGAMELLTDQDAVWLFQRAFATAQKDQFDASVRGLPALSVDKSPQHDVVRQYVDEVTGLDGLRRTTEFTEAVRHVQDDIVRELRAAGETWEAIADALGVTTKTLRKRFRADD